MSHGNVRTQSQSSSGVPLKILLRFLRRAGESCVSILIAAIFLLPVLLFARKPAREKTFARWRHFITAGWYAFRDAWWDTCRLEPPLTVFRHVLLLECADARVALSEPRTAVLPLVDQARVLVVSLGHMGDLLHTIPLLRNLRGQRPNATIDLLVGPWNAELARAIPYVNDVMVHRPSMVMFHRGARASCDATVNLKDLRSRAYDALVSSANTNMADFLVWLAAGAGITVGVTMPFAALYNTGALHGVTYDSSAYEAERITRLLVPLGLHAGSTELEIPAMPGSASEGDGARVVVVAPGGGWSGKMWMADRFSALCTWLKNDMACQVVLVGSASEAAMIDGIVAAAAVECVNLAGRTSLGQLIAAIRASQLFIGNDSGPLHIAVACHVPAVGLFGPTRVPKWMPRGSSYAALSASYPCEGCIPWHACATCLHGRECMKRISLEQVEEAVVALLRNGGPALSDEAKVVRHA